MCGCHCSVLLPLCVQPTTVKHILLLLGSRGEIRRVFLFLIFTSSDTPRDISMRFCKCGTGTYSWQVPLQWHLLSEPAIYILWAGFRTYLENVAKHLWGCLSVSFAIEKSRVEAQTCSQIRLQLPRGLNLVL